MDANLAYFDGSEQEPGWEAIPPRPPAESVRAEFEAWLNEVDSRGPRPEPPPPAKPRPVVRLRTTEERLERIETTAQADAHAWAELLDEQTRDRRRAKLLAKTVAALAAEVASLAADLSALSRALRPRVVATADDCGEAALSLAGDC